MKSIYTYFIKPHRVKLLLILLLAIIVPLISNTIPYLSQRILDVVLQQGNNNLLVLISYASTAIVLVILKSIFTSYIQNSCVEARTHVGTDLKKYVLGQVINLPISFHDQNSTQYILSRINEVNHLVAVFSPATISSLIGILSGFFALFLIFSIHKTLGFIILVSLPFLLLIVAFNYQSMQKQMTDIIESSAKNSEDLYSTLNSAITLKTLNQEKLGIDHITRKIESFSEKTKAQNIAINRKTNTIIACVSCFQTLMLCVSAFFINDGSLSPTAYLSLYQYFALVYAPILSIQNMYVTLKPAMISQKRLKEFIVAPKPKKGLQHIDVIHSLSIDHLSFSYNGTSSVFTNVAFSIKKGDRLFITGANGTGKTTLIKVLLGFYDSYIGKIKYNGIDLREISTTSLRNRISYMPQKPFLFDDTVLHNITISNRTISQKNLKCKLDHFKRIHLLDSIDLNLRVSENGKNLSGGQIQRIMLARMLLRESDILIFDECSNSLDEQTKCLIKNIIKTECDNKMCIIISHDKEFYPLATQFLSLDNVN